jgi:hypothetical protein
MIKKSAINESRNSSNKDPNQIVTDMISKMMGVASNIEQSSSGSPGSVNFTGYSFDPSTYKPAREMKKGGKVSSASKRADGIAKRGKTKGRIV